MLISEFFLHRADTTIQGLLAFAVLLASTVSPLHISQPRASGARMCTIVSGLQAVVVVLLQLRAAVLDTAVTFAMCTVISGLQAIVVELLQLQTFAGSKSFASLTLHLSAEDPLLFMTIEHHEGAVHADFLLE